MFGGHQAEIGHQLPRIGEASKCTLGLDRQLVVIGANLALSVPAELGVAAVPAALELIKDGVAKMAWSITCCIAPGSMPRAGLGFGAGASASQAQRRRRGRRQPSGCRPMSPQSTLSSAEPRPRLGRSSFRACGLMPGPVDTWMVQFTSQRRKSVLGHAFD